jgi:cell pole-organizing protein PopZ
VLELTDMVSDNGSIVKIKKDGKSPDMGSFLRLVQENADRNDPSALRDTGDASRSAINERYDESLKSPLYGIIREIVSPLLKEWVNDNLPSIVTKVVEAEVKSFLYKSSGGTKN